MLAVLLALLALAAPVLLPPTAARADETGTAPAARRLTTASCRAIDPNLVHGLCLRVPTASGEVRTWIGSYRAPDGRVFFCIDYLYDSRLPGHAQRRSTRGLVNQLGHRVGRAEVAALNALVSRQAPHGSTGSDTRDAAIALIVREVMSDGVRGGGAVVYPPGLRAGGQVQAPAGGLPGGVLTTARSMWRDASRSRGPVRLRLTRDSSGELTLGHAVRYRLDVESAAGRPISGLAVHWTCSGPVRCPRDRHTAAHGVMVRLKPRGVGRFTLAASVTAPAADGLLYVDPGWHAHGGSAARTAGRQRAWIARASVARRSVRASAVVVEAGPTVVTTAVEQTALPGAMLHDRVRVSGLATGHRRHYRHPITARLFGPFDHQPGAHECTASRLAGSVRVLVDGNGTVTTPGVAVHLPGRYTWTEELPGDRWTAASTTPCGLVSETSLVRKLTPHVSTRAVTGGSPAGRVEVGRRMHDEITVSGTDDQPVTARWSLLGPVSPAGEGEDRSCADRDWTHAHRLATGSVAFAGAGTHRTPGVRLPAAGCYSYAVTIASTATTEAAAEPAGAPTETVLALPRHLALHTMVSAQSVTVGHSLRDDVRLGGLGRHDRVRLAWQLLGPIAPVAGRCTGLDWSGAPEAAHGSVTVTAPGRLRTPSARIGAPGCWTFAEQVAATGTTEPVDSAPGLAAETALATRPTVAEVRAVPSGPHGPVTDPRFYAAPRALVRNDAGGRLQVASVGIDAPVDQVGADGHRVAVPGAVSHVGWFTGSAAAADVVGSSVLVGHVSDEHDRPGALGALHRVRAGAVVSWTAPGADGSPVSTRFRVTSVRHYPRSHDLPASLFVTGGDHVLRLITCADRQDLPGGRFHYADNLVVTAVPI